MKLSDALLILQAEKPIIVRDTTFVPRGVDEAVLDSGETVYWAHDNGGGKWLSIDPEGEEIMLFEDVDDTMEADDEILVYRGQDYEFSYESRVTILEEDGGTVVTMREFEGPTAIIRVLEDETTGEVTHAYGVKLTEEELQPLA